MMGFNVGQEGSRSKSYDLEILSVNDGFDNPYFWRSGLVAGRYEVKALWQRSPKHAFDPRFKVGRRGEQIYGRRDAAIKAFALSLERLIEEGGYAHGRPFVEATHDFIDHAIERKHSKKFERRLERLATAALATPLLTFSAQRVLTTSVQAIDIVRGFVDIEGIFVVAGPLYTLVTKAEMPTFLTFDSASSEGPKLRWASVVPSESTKRRNDSKKKKETKK